MLKDYKTGFFEATSMVRAANNTVRVGTPFNMSQ